MASDKQLVAVNPYSYFNPYFTDVSPNPYSIDGSVYGVTPQYGATPQYYPYLVPIPIEPQGPPPPPPVRKGPTEQEVLEERRLMEKSNRDLTIAIIILFLLLLACIGGIIGIIFGPKDTVTLPGQVVSTTTIGYEIIKPALVFGPTLANKNSLAFVNSQVEFCDMNKIWFAGVSDMITDCTVDSFSSGSLKAKMQVTFKNNGKTSATVLSEVKAIVIAQSTSDARTSTVLDSSFSIVSTGTTAGATVASPATFAVLLLSTTVLLCPWL